MLDDFFYMLDLMNNPWFINHVLPYHVAFIVAIIVSMYFVYKDEQRNR